MPSSTGARRTRTAPPRALDTSRWYRVNPAGIFQREVEGPRPGQAQRVRTQRGCRRPSSCFGRWREFALEFVFAVEAAGIRHRYIRPRRPQQNGKVERSHRIDQEEFWGRHKFTDFEEAATGLSRWERTYNYDRFSLALRGYTPAEKLAGPAIVGRLRIEGCDAAESTVLGRGQS